MVGDNSPKFSQQASQNLGKYFLKNFPSGPSPAADLDNSAKNPRSRSRRRTDAYRVYRLELLATRFGTDDNDDFDLTSIEPSSSLPVCAGRMLHATVAFNP